MRTERLYDGITQVADDLIEQAAQPCVPQKKPRRWAPSVAAAAACAVLLLTLSRFAGLGVGGDAAAPEAAEPGPMAPGAAPGSSADMELPTPAPNESETPYTVYMKEEEGCRPVWRLEDTFARSTLVAVCTITGETESFFVQENGETAVIYSEQTAVVERVILGEAPETIRLRRPGGTVGLCTVVYESQPVWQEGKTYLLFLMKPDAGLGGLYTEGDYYMLVSGRNGSYEQMPQGHFASTRGVKLEESELVVPDGVEPYSLRKDRLEKYADELSRGQITRAAYEEKVEKLDQYAVILEE